MVYKFLFTQNKILGPYIQGFSADASNFGTWDVSGQAMFSADGTKYATTIHGYGKVFVADFDRCSGNLTNPRVYKVPAQKIDSTNQYDSTTCGLAFSPNGRYLYVNGFYNVLQLDLNNASAPTAWTRLRGLDTTDLEFQRYSNIYPGLDGRLYVGNWDGLGGQMSVIEDPDKLGLSSSFCPKCLRFPGFVVGTTTRFAGVSGPPNMPNYALGHTSPICYPVGIDKPKTRSSVFQIYPNPSHGLIEVRCEEEGKLHIIDMLGREMSDFVLVATYSSIDLTHLPKGVYQYRFKGSTGLLKSGQLVLN
jgi:hypothetical protein